MEGYLIRSSTVLLCCLRCYRTSYYLKYTECLFQIIIVLPSVSLCIHELLCIKRKQHSANIYNSIDATRALNMVCLISLNSFKVARDNVTTKTAYRKKIIQCPLYKTVIKRQSLVRNFSKQKIQVETKTLDLNNRWVMLASFHKLFKS